MSVTRDERVVLPLGKVQVVALAYCLATCRGRWPGPQTHDLACLIPSLEQRTRQLGEAADLQAVSPDCQTGGVKCRACTGCAHDCHRHSARVPSPS